MAVEAWLLDKSAAGRLDDPVISRQILELAGQLYLCPVGILGQLYSARSGQEYDEFKADLFASFRVVSAPVGVFDEAMSIQEDLAHHHGLWHRIPIPDLLLAATALHYELGIVHVDADFERIAEVRPIVARRLRP